MNSQFSKEQFPDAVSRELKGGFTITMPYGGFFEPQDNGAYMCVAVAHNDDKPIFRVEGIEIKDEPGSVVSSRNYTSPIALCNFLTAHENITRGLEKLGDEPAPIQRHGDWFYYVHVNPETGVHNVTALMLGHLGVLNVRCMEKDVLYVLEHTAAEA